MYNKLTIYYLRTYIKYTLDLCTVNFSVSLTINTSNDFFKSSALSGISLIKKHFNTKRKKEKYANCTKKYDDNI